MVKTLTTKVKRGDTVIEVMFAFAVFALVAILSIAMMNSGIATSERSLELVVARNELNAQAEALRFIHSSYVSELTLPTCDEVSSSDEKCQQFNELWGDITANAVTIGEYNSNIPTPLNSCQEVYDNDNARLRNVKAFILNVRRLGTIQEGNKIYSGNIYKKATDTLGSNLIFQPAPLGARLVYSSDKNSVGADDDMTVEDNAGITSNQQGYNTIRYNNLVRAEGIWAVAIESGAKGSDGKPLFYDFRIQTCWYGSGNVAPTTLDTVIRLNNPEILK